MLGGRQRKKMIVKDKFPDYFDYMKRKGLKEKTVIEHKRFLYGSISHCPISEKRIKTLKLVDIAYLIESGKQHGEYGSQRAVCVFRSYLNFLEDSGIRLPFKWEKIKIPKVPQKEQIYLTEQEFNDFLEKIPLNTLYGLRDRALYEVLFSTGGRISEILNLKRSEIDWIKKEAKIKNSKTGDEETIYFSDRSLKWLKRYLETRADNHSALFVTYGFRGITRLIPVVARRHL